MNNKIKQNKAAFTIVELIIVIAVIGVLAAILIPTFSNIIEKANAKSALSDARNTLTSYLSESKEREDLPASIVIIIEKAKSFYAYGYTSSQEQLSQSKNNPYTGYADADAFIADQTGSSSATGKTFYLASNTRTVSYNCLNSEMDRLSDGVQVYEGYLLPAVAVLTGDNSSISTAGINFTDMKGRAVHLDAPAQRVVVMQAADCEILYAIGAGDTIIGRGAYCDYPSEVLSIPSVESGYEMNVETVIALDPDAIIMPVMYQKVEQVNALANAGIAVVVTDAQTIASTYNAISLIGLVTGHETEADTVIENMKTAFDSIRTQVAAQTAVERKIYFEVSELSYGLWTTGQGTFMQELSDMLKVTNVFSDLTGWASISEEQVIARNPDYIVSTSLYSWATSEPAADEIKGRAGWGSITAVANDDVISISDEISRPGPRLVEAAQMLYSLIYG